MLLIFRFFSNSESHWKRFSEIVSCWSFIFALKSQERKLEGLKWNRFFVFTSNFQGQLWWSVLNIHNCNFSGSERNWHLLYHISWIRCIRCIRSCHCYKFGQRKGKNGWFWSMLSPDKYVGAPLIFTYLFFLVLFRAPEKYSS